MKLTGSRCRCRACGEYFNSTKAFDRHRKDRQVLGDSGLGEMVRVCRTPAELVFRGWSKNAGGFWVTESLSVDAQNRRSAAPAALAAPSP